VPRQRGALNRLFQLNRRGIHKLTCSRMSLERLLGLPLRRGHGQLSGQVDGSATVAAIALVSETRRDVDQAPDGILNYCRTKVRFGVVEAVHGNIRMLINRGRWLSGSPLTWLLNGQRDWP